jgi:hypothetical protein
MGEDDMFETTFCPLQIHKINWSQKPSRQGGELQAPEQGEKVCHGFNKLNICLGCKNGINR